MPNYTKNYNLIKPNKTENYDIEDVTNKNMDIIDEELFGKVDKVPGKALSTNDFTNEYKNKLDKLENYNDEELKNKLNEQVQKNNLQEEKIEELNLKQINLQNENTQLKNQIPTGTAEGESIYLSDSSDLEAKIIVKGNSRQRTSDGSNLYNVKDGYYTTGDPIVDSEDFITMSFDNTSGTSTKFINYFTKPNLNLKTATRYYGVLEIKNFVGSASFFVSAQQGTEAQTDAWLENKLTAENSNTKRLFEFTTINDFSNTANMFRTFLRLQAGENASITFRISVFEQKPDLETFVYQPYGIMPSPEHPSNVETVGSNVNLINLADIEETTKNGITYSISNGIIALNGTATQNFNLYLENHFEIPAGDYTLSNNFQGTYSGVVGHYLFTYPSNSILFNGDKIDSIDKTKALEQNNVRYGLYFASGAVLNNVILKPKLEKGTKATSYSPHNQRSIEINVINKNFIVTDNIEKTINGVSVVCKDGVLVLNGKATGSIQIDFSVFKLKAGTYKMSRGVVSGSATGSFENYLRKQDGSSISGATSNSKITFEEDIKVKYRFFANINAQFNNYTMIPMLELGSVSTTHETGKSQTKILPIQEEMLEDDYIEDVEYHTWGKIIFTGNESWQKSTKTTVNRYYINTIVFSSTDKENVIHKCNYLTCISQNDSDKDKLGLSNYNGRGFMINFSLEDSNFSTLEQFKTWLQEKYNSGNPVVVYYKLATSKSLPLTEEQKNILNKKTYTYKNITNINTNSIAILDVTYKKDLETLFNQVNQVLIERS